MSDHRNGHRFRIPASRRLTWDLLTFHQAIPLCSHDRRMKLAPIAEARTACVQRISWPALFIKAYGLVAMKYPELRQTWYQWPWAHLYQHPSSVAVLTVQRYIIEEPWLFWGEIRNPENQSLAEIQQAIDVFSNGEPQQIFAKQWKMAHLPTIFRRAIWWWNLNVETRKRATRIGTFLVSTLAGLGAEIQLPPSVQTGCLTYGPLEENGTARVTLAYDHRIMDGALVARILNTLEETLNQCLVAELASLNNSADTGKVA